MSEYMKNEKVIYCKLREDDFIRVGKNNVRDGVGIIVSERDDEASVCLSWEGAKVLSDHLTSLISDEKEFGTYAAHQPGYENFKRSGKLDDHAYQSLVHMQNASHQLSWALTALDHAAIPDEIREEVRLAVRESANTFGALQEKLRAYVK